MDEQQAIQALKRGEIAGLEALAARYQVKAIRAAYLITRDTHLAQDVVQDVFLQVYRGIGRFDAARPFEPWFMRSVVNAALKVSQKTAREIPIEGDDENGLEQWIIAQETVEGQVETAESHEKLWQAMQELSPRQRAAIVQRYFLEMSEKEMADELNAPPGTVKWLLNAARERLRSLLGSERSAR
jgi:RNA polymerase sigma-70 factor (ECF subfamily)